MNFTLSRLTVYFEEPFWVAVYEREYGGRQDVSKVTFGAEPKDYEVYGFFLTNFSFLRFSPSVEAEEKRILRVNPKRVRREISKQLQNPGIGTKAQQALKLHQEQGKQERKVYSREQRETEKRRRFVLRQDKQKEKHKGR